MRRGMGTCCKQGKCYRSKLQIKITEALAVLEQWRSDSQLFIGNNIHWELYTMLQNRINHP